MHSTTLLGVAASFFALVSASCPTGYTYHLQDTSTGKYAVLKNDAAIGDETDFIAFTASSSAKAGFVTFVQQNGGCQLSTVSTSMEAPELLSVVINEKLNGKNFVFLSGPTSEKQNNVFCTASAAKTLKCKVTATNKAGKTVTQSVLQLIGNDLAIGATGTAGTFKLIQADFPGQ